MLTFIKYVLHHVCMACKWADFQARSRRRQNQMVLMWCRHVSAWICCRQSRWFLMGCQDISICVGGKRTDAGDETSGHLQAYFVATELGVFEKMSGHFYGCICAGKNTTGRSIYRPVRGDKTRYLWWHVKTTPDVFGADRTGCFSRDIWTIPDLFVADRTWCCFVATQQEMCFLCLNLTRAALSRLKIEGWTLTNMQNCHVKKRKASTYPSFAELCIADVY